MQRENNSEDQMQIQRPQRPTTSGTVVRYFASLRLTKCQPLPEKVSCHHNVHADIQLS
jgi:hypothetical protein